jgi:hypothetical protein
MNPTNPNRQAVPDIDLANTTAVACEKCNCESLFQAFHLREVSAIASGTGKAGMIPIQVFACTQCGNVLERFLPVELRPTKLVA